MCLWFQQMCAPSTSFGLFVPVLRARRRIGHQVAFIGKWKIPAAPRLGGQMASPANGQMQAQSTTFQTATGVTWSQYEQNQMVSRQCHQTQGQGWPQRFQTSQPTLQKQSQGAQGCMQPLTTNRVSHIAPRDIKGSAAHTPKSWTPEHQQHLPHEQFHTGALPLRCFCMAHLWLYPEAESHPKLTMRTLSSEGM